MFRSPRGSALGRTGVVAALIGALALGFTAANAQEPTPGDTAHVDTLVTLPFDPPVTPPPATLVPTAATLASTTAIAPPSNLLPFADNVIPATYPAIAVSIGVAGYLSDFRGIDQAFAAVEDSIETSGFAVASTSKARPGAMSISTIDLFINRTLDIACQVGFSASEANEMRLLGGIVSGRTTLRGAPNVSLLGGLGGGAYGFKFEKQYGSPISATDGSGGYTVLDFIKLEGGGSYWTAAGRVAIRTDTHITFEGLAQYVGANDVTMDAGRFGIVTANVSGTMLGVSLMIFF